MYAMAEIIIGQIKISDNMHKKNIPTLLEKYFNDTWKYVNS